jgi:uncharacterized protein YqjF (DUF2071 family)
LIGLPIELLDKLRPDAAIPDDNDLHGWVSVNPFRKTNPRRGTRAGPRGHARHRLPSS